MSPSMSSRPRPLSPTTYSESSSSLLLRWQRRLGARLARPQALFLGPEGVQIASEKAQPFADWCRMHAGQAADITVSTQLLHELVCEPGLPLGDEAQLQAYARQLFGHYFGAPAKSWPLATWRLAAAAPWAEQCGAVALHGAAAASLQEVAAAHQLHLLRVQPAWAPVLRRLATEQPEWCQAPKAALAWVEGQVLTWLQLQDGRLQSLRQLRLAEATVAALGETLAELSATDAPGAAQLSSVLVCGYGLAAGSPAPSWPGLRVLGRLDGKVPEAGCFDDASAAAKLAGLPRPDFLGPRPPRSPWAWPLAGLGGLALVAALLGAVHSQQALNEAQQRQQSLSAEASQQPVARPPAASLTNTSRSSSSSGGKTQDLETLRAAAEVQALLLQPWQAVLSNVEQAGAQASSGPASAAEALSWLALDYNAGRQELRLEGLVADKLLALQMVDRLSATPGWQAVMLSRFQSGEQGLQGQRFELTAKLKPAELRVDLPAKAASEAQQP